ncbi:DUF2797 domain-containing protein [Marinilabilia rubra]|uniref:DUF2797 domain-containing protein n=1 Tax=Marinilabilia rubra TaxID=2162893 RepID=A0A2U2B8K7_9BACT|nr:DUF2797 domain-containing protein [Marinilabilia rubra]PWD99421.1 DUF2797 domain-containing protein [Marinilabilia rubra]
MKEYQGNLIKMNSGLKNNQVSYSLKLEDEDIEMNHFLDKSISLVYQNRINCINCGKETKKSFGQGFCYQCFTTAPQADECVLRPDKCKAHLGISRDVAWSDSHCLQPHIVYLAVSGGLKVGVTRLSQVPARWVDQGATKAIKLCEAPNRHIAGVIEKYLMQSFGDKTNWKKMVTNGNVPDFDLMAEKKKAVELLPSELKRYVLSSDNEVFEFEYPVLKWPEKPQQENLDKNPEVNGVLKGIKGQYLLFGHQTVFNVRRFSGYAVKLKVE